MNKSSKVTQADLDSAMDDLNETIRQSGLTGEELSDVLFKASVQEMLDRHGMINTDLMFLDDVKKETMH